MQILIPQKATSSFARLKAIDCTITEAFNTAVHHPFKGNVDLEKLEPIIKEHGAEKIPFINITVTCNTVGGQPVSLENIKATSALAKKYNIPLYMDIARYAENAYFIKTRETAYADWSIEEIIREMFEDVAVVWMRAKKDGLVNIGGFIALHDEELYNQLGQFTII